MKSFQALTTNGICPLLTLNVLKGWVHDFLFDLWLHTSSTHHATGRLSGGGLTLALRRKLRTHTMCTYLLHQTWRRERHGYIQLYKVLITMSSAFPISMVTAYWGGVEPDTTSKPLPLPPFPHQNTKVIIIIKFWPIFLSMLGRALNVTLCTVSTSIHSRSCCILYSRVLFKVSHKLCSGWYIDSTGNYNYTCTH